jgi:RNA ligase (TIGR02306 family)
MNTTRKLASIRKIDDLKEIPGADLIEVAVVGGWNVVVKKGEFTAGDLAVYLEIDSFVPNALAPFLTRAGHFPKSFSVTNEDGSVTTVEGERLKTIRLRGQLSQGLLLPLSVCTMIDSLLIEGLDVTLPLGIVKWEKPVPAQLAGLIRGNFPTAIPKTDQERCQNLVKEIHAAIEADLTFEVTEKLEGSSMTCYLIDGEFGVCSRNLDLKRDENNSFWATAIRDDIEAKMRAVGPNPGEDWGFAIQGECVGPGIQGNIYKLSRTEFFVFDVYDIKRGEYLKPDERRCLIATMGLKHAPVLTTERPLSPVAMLLDWADGKSVLGDTLREGIVFKQVDGGMSFKAISNKYLMGEK